MKPDIFLYNKSKGNCGYTRNNDGMKIQEAMPILKAEQAFGKTPIGRPLTEYAVETIAATIEDTKNYGQETTVCLNCGFLASSLLFESGCKNCNSKDISSEVKY